MSTPRDELVLGEFRRALDDRYRLSLPAEWVDAYFATPADRSGAADEAPAVLAKERPGCLSLWPAERWQRRLDQGIDLIRAKLRAGKLEAELGQVQLLGRLLSTRQTRVTLAGRGRLVIPEGFREFLGVEPQGEVCVIGAALCVELWNPADWLKYLRRRMPRFRTLFDRLSG